MTRRVLTGRVSTDGTWPIKDDLYTPGVSFTSGLTDRVDIVAAGDTSESFLDAFVHVTRGSHTTREPHDKGATRQGSHTTREPHDKVVVSYPLDVATYCLRESISIMVVNISLTSRSLRKRTRR